MKTRGAMFTPLVLSKSFPGVGNREIGMCVTE